LSRATFSDPPCSFEMWQNAHFTTLKKEAKKILFPNIFVTCDSQSQRNIYMSKKIHKSYCEFPPAQNSIELKQQLLNQELYQNMEKSQN